MENPFEKVLTRYVEKIRGCHKVDLRETAYEVGAKIPGD
jgi:hypothetical protein